MFRRILLAADGSPHSMRAMEKAIYIAANGKGTSITLIHVIDDIPSQTDVMDETLATGQEVPEHRKENTSFIEKRITKEGIPLVMRHVYGDPGPSIVREANDGKYDIVVIGSRGLNKFQQLVLGSVSHKVAKRTECPVLIVK